MYEYLTFTDNKIQNYIILLNLFKKINIQLLNKINKSILKIYEKKYEKAIVFI